MMSGVEGGRGGVTETRPKVCSLFTPTGLLLYRTTGSTELPHPTRTPRGSGDRKERKNLSKISIITWGVLYVTHLVVIIFFRTNRDNVTETFSVLRSLLKLL